MVLLSVVKMMKDFAFQIYFLSLMKLSTVQSTCKQEIVFGPVICILRCTSNIIVAGGIYSQAQNMDQIEGGYAELSLCREEGIKLELNNYDSPSFVVRANSFTANIKVNYLEYSLIAVSGMEANSLNATAFKTVTKLVFTNTSIDIFRNGLFNGLESVEQIHFKDVSDASKIIENGILDVLNRTLTEFTFEQSTRTSNEIVIDGFTGSAVLPQLRTVKYMYNLRYSITNKSFVGLEMVKTLDLSYCQIETFGVGAFDAISASVETLKLGNNFIKTLPGGLFDIMLPSYYTIIHLEGNEKWICDCALMPFKADLLEHSSNFNGEAKCDSPIEYKSFEIVETNFCQPTTTTEVPTDITTEITTTTPYEFPQECFQAEKTDKVSTTVTIKGPSQKISIIESESGIVGGIALQIDVQMENRILLWFSQDDSVTNFSEINCQTVSGSLIQVTNLTEKATFSHTFCVMNSAEKTISPLDCISYAARDYRHKQPWLNESKKGFAIGMITIICTLSVLTGVASGCVALKVYANGNPIASNGTMNTQHRLSATTSDIIANRAMNTGSQRIFDNNECVPPLPPRPFSIPIKEYTYATVE